MPIQKPSPVCAVSRNTIKQVGRVQAPWGGVHKRRTAGTRGFDTAVRKPNAALHQFTVRLGKHTHSQQRKDTPIQPLQFHVACPA